MGINTITTVLVPALAISPAKPLDLTDLATLKDELQITDTSRDSFLQRAISQVSTAIATHCNRVFQVETVQDAIYPQRDAYPYMVPGTIAPLMLSRYPILGFPGPCNPIILNTSGATASGSVIPFANASAVPIGAPAVGLNIPIATTVTAVTNTGPIAAAAPTPGGGGAGYALGDTGTVPGYTGDAAYRVTGQTGGAVTAIAISAPGTSYRVSGGNATATGGGQPGSGTGLQIDITAISVTASTVALSAALQAPLPLASPVTFGLSVTVTNPANTIQQLTAGADYLINGEDGFLTRLNTYTGYQTGWDPVQTTIIYQAGYPVIPDDLVDVVLRSCTGRNSARGRDPLVRTQDQPGLGTTTWWVGTAPGVKGAFPEEIVDLIDRYRVPVAR